MYINSQSCFYLFYLFFVYRILCHERQSRPRESNNEAFAEDAMDRGYTATGGLRGGIDGRVDA